MDRMDILDSAKTIVTGREQQHGDIVYMIPISQNEGGEKEDGNR